VQEYLLQSNSTQAPPEIDPGINLNFVTVNTNSLNVSSGNKYQQKTKIYGIARMRADIIFLSDIRINEATGLSHKETIEHLFKFNPYKSYDCYFNSTRSARGVGILIATELEYNIENTCADRNENIIVMRINVGGHTCTVGAVYGPNSRDPEFFNELTNYITDLGSDRIILGGDWNCVPNVTPIQVNLDCLNMINLPNPGQSENLVRFMDRNNLCDVFRAKYPVLREFTYVPYGTVRKNRSRIDFFLISEELVTHVTTCKISDAPATKLFDHKSVLCSLKRVKTLRKKLPIKNSTLNDPVIPIVAELTVTECHLHTVNQDQYGGRDRVNRALEAVANCWNLLRIGGVHPKHVSLTELDVEYVQTHERVQQEIREIMRGFNLPVLESLDKTISDADFYSNLMLVLKNELYSYQTVIRNSRYKQRKSLENLLKRSKEDAANGSDMIFNLEKQLQQLEEEEIRAELEASPLFDCFNNEKISSYTKKLLQANKNEASLRSIRNENGANFNNESEQKNFIVNYFSEIYRKRDTADGEEIIEEFLGEQMVQHPVIVNSKLTEIERELLEMPLTINELDKAMKSAKPGTAAGIDGIGNQVLKKCWQILRVPLYRCATDSLTNSTLPHNFKTAAIKLIPKKGQSEHIKNWRPISLLNCSYKLLSKALNNRLKTVNDRLLSRAQKGFVSHRSIHEVLINLIERISYCKSTGIQTALLSVDFSKVFDIVF